MPSPPSRRPVPSALRARLERLLDAGLPADVDVARLNSVLSPAAPDGHGAGAAVHLDWPGKAHATAILSRPFRGRMERAPGQGRAEDTTRHRLIVGDNLDGLRVLAAEAPESVDLVYIDPPYNTGKSFSFNDSFERRLDANDGAAASAQASNGRGGDAQANWLNFLLPRIHLMRQVLRPQGIWMAHIDEHGHEALVLAAREIFGANNYLGSIVWDKGNPKGDARRIAYQHEHIVLFARDKSQSPRLQRPKANANRMLRAARRLLNDAGNIDDARDQFRIWVKSAEGLSGGERMYHRISDDGRVYRLVSMAWPNKKTAPERYFTPLIHPRTNHPCPVPARGWRNPPETMAKLRDAELIEFGADHQTQPQRRYYLDEHMHENVPSIIRYAGSDDARLQAMGIPFEHPKPTELAAQLIRWCSSPKAVVLDCFAGSGTTGHAVWEANAADAGTRRWILMQSPEPLTRGTKTGAFTRVDEITRARLLGAAEALASHDSDAHEMDHGFVVEHVRPEATPDDVVS